MLSKNEKIKTYTKKLTTEIKKAENNKNWIEMKP